MPRRLRLEPCSRPDGLQLLQVSAATLPRSHASPHSLPRWCCVQARDGGRGSARLLGAYDCWERTVLLVNGQLSPTLELVQGEELQVREGHEAGISVEEWV